MKEPAKPIPMTERFLPDAGMGLAREQVGRRMREGLYNRAVQPGTKPVWRILFDNTFTLFNLIIAVLGAAVMLVGSYENALFALVMLINLVIGIAQELRAKHTIDKLSILSAARANAVRDGRIEPLLDEEIVLDDVLDFTGGQQIPVDCKVLDGRCLVNEALVTGESRPIVKVQGDDLLSGSFVVSGHCRARTEHVGADNYASRIASGAKKHKRAQSEILRAVRGIIRVISIVILPTGALLLRDQLLSVAGGTLQSAVISTSAALVGMIPEGLVLLTTTVLAISVIRLSRRRVMIQELHCIESLARVDVLCLDKTGTLTEGRMQLADVLPLGGADRQEIDAALGALCAALGDGSETMRAISRLFKGGDDWEALRVQLFSSELKWSGASFKGRGSYVLGAPEFVLPRERLPDDLDTYAAENRVLLLAHAPGGLEPDALPEDLSPVALLLMRDALRQSAPDTLRFFAQQGVAIKIISGDNPATVQAVATRAGVPDAHLAIDATELHSIEDIAEAVGRYAVFSRVTPEQKKQMILALKEKGHTVAMTGDGVNDVLALREADCSIAIASGSDAARNVSNLVLLDSDFSAMPHVVAEGRRAINNLQRSASLFLVKTIYSAALTLMTLLFRMQYPFIPIQLTLIGSLTIGIPAFVLALEPNRQRVQGNFLRNVISRALPAAISVVALIGAMTALLPQLGFSHRQLSTIGVLTTSFIGLLLIVRMSIPFTLTRRFLITGIPLALAIAAIFLSGPLRFAPMTQPTLTALLCAFVAAFALFSALLKLFKNGWPQKKRPG